MVLLHWEFAHSLFSLFGIAMVKISVSLLLLRLVPQKNYRRFLWSIIGEKHTLKALLTVNRLTENISISFRIHGHVCPDHHLVLSPDIGKLGPQSASNSKVLLDQNIHRARNCKQW